MTESAKGPAHHDSSLQTGTEQPRGSGWTLTVGPGQQGLRLDRFLSEICGIGRRKVRRLLEAGVVHLDQGKARPGTKLRQGWTLHTNFDPKRIADQGPMPDPMLQIPVIEETRDILVLDKPAGIDSVALDPMETGSLANFLAANHPECVEASLRAGADPLEAGLVHRLDRETSGIILAARTADAYRAWRRLSTEGRLFKRYLALVQGALEGSGTIDYALVTLRHKPRKMGVASDQASHAQALEARSAYRVLESRPDMSLVEVTLARGRPHQVRVHLSSIGHPILGDKLYGGPPSPEGVGTMALRCVALFTAAEDSDTWGSRPSIHVEIPPPREWLALFREHSRTRST